MERANRRVLQLLLFLLCYLPLCVSGVKPGFITPLENITVATGRNARFTCHVKKLGGHKLAWLRSDSKAILAIHNHMVTNNPRMSVGHNDGQLNSWTLEIKNVQRNDSGIYMCQINTEPMTSQVGYLRVVEAPDILYSETSNDTIVNEGSDLRLRCKARGYPEPTLTWRREDKRLIRHGRSNEKVPFVEGPILDLKKLTRADIGAYLCIASNGIPSPVSKRIMVKVQFPPMITVRDQLIATKMGSTIKLVCIVEASPKTVNYWEKKIRKSNGDVVTRSINPSRKYQIQEEAESVYSERFSLTIHHVRRNDFGNYSCISRSALGNVTGTMTLQELKVPKVYRENFIERNNYEMTTKVPKFAISTMKNNDIIHKNGIVDEYFYDEEEEEEVDGSPLTPPSTKNPRRRKDKLHHHHVSSSNRRSLSVLLLIIVIMHH